MFPDTVVSYNSMFLLEHLCSLVLTLFSFFTLRNILYVCMPVYELVGMSVLVYVFLRLMNVYVFVRVCVYVYMCVCVCVCMCICLCVMV